MDFSSTTKMKVAIICHFSNSKIRAHLNLDNRKLYNLVRRLIGLPQKSSLYADIASWNTNLIENLSSRQDIDLYVISAHSGMTQPIQQFELENVKYWFLKCDVATLLKHLIPSSSIWHKLNPMRPKVRQIIKNLKPDIIALMGAENAYISGTVLGLENNFPIIVKAQTIYNNPERYLNGYFDKKNGYVERLIFKRMKYFSATGELHCKLFRSLNPHGLNFPWEFSTTFPQVKNLPVEFDFVNFAMAMSIKKGFPDALIALHYVKKQYPQIKLNLIGGGTEEQIKLIREQVKELELEQNVTITPLFPDQKDLFQHIQKARFALLPCKMDDIASTIRQAMHYELPVVCYRTKGGTETLNEKRETVLLAENNNPEDLAKKMLLLMQNNSLSETLKHNAKIYSDSQNDNKAITNQIVENFKVIIENFKFETPVPQNYLYDGV